MFVVDDGGRYGAKVVRLVGVLIEYLKDEKLMVATDIRIRAQLNARRRTPLRRCIGQDSVDHIGALRACGAATSFRCPPPSSPVVGRRNLDLPALDAPLGEEHSGPRAELAELPARVYPFEHGGREGALHVGARRELPRFQDGAVHVSDRVTARLFRGLQGVINVASHGLKR